MDSGAPLSTVLVAHSSADSRWAAWIAWRLEENGYQVHLQQWDLLTGHNQAAWLDRALSLSGRIVVVLSATSLREVAVSQYWRDKPGEVIPVRVEPCSLTGLLRHHTTVDLYNLNEAAARSALDEAFRVVKSGSRRPVSTPPFPPDIDDLATVLAPAPAPAAGRSAPVAPGDNGNQRRRLWTTPHRIVRSLSSNGSRRRSTATLATVAVVAAAAVAAYSYPWSSSRDDSGSGSPLPVPSENLVTSKPAPGPTVTVQPIEKTGSMTAPQPVEVAEFSHSGSLLATAASPGEIILWDTTEPVRPKNLAIVPYEIDEVYDLAFSPDDTMLATSSKDVVLWDIKDPAHPRRVVTIEESGATAVTSVAFSADGKTLATGSSPDATIILRDLSDPARPGPMEILRRPPGPGEVIDLTFTAGGRTLASLTSKNPQWVFLWSVDDLLPVGRLPHDEAVQAMRGAAAEPVVVTALDGRGLVSWSVLRPGAPDHVEFRKGEAVRELVFNSDGSLMLSVSSFGDVMVWDFSDPERPKLVSDLRTVGVWRATFSDKDHGILTLSTSGKLTAVKLPS